MVESGTQPALASSTDMLKFMEDALREVQHVHNAELADIFTLIDLL